MKTYRIIHITANIIAVGLLTAFLVYFLLSYGSLPERIGVHFSPLDGEFDVYAKKLFGFFPFVAGFALFLIFSLLTLAVNKVKKLGFKVDETGDRLLRCAAVLMLDVMKLVWSGFFSFWTVCVVQQRRMGDGDFLDAFRVFFLLMPLAAVIVFLEISSKHKAEPDNAAETEAPESVVLPKQHRIGHILMNIAAFGLLGGFLVYFLLSYGTLPERIGIHFDSNGDFDVYSYKVFGFYPFVAGGGLLIVFSLISLAAGKLKKTGLRLDSRGNMLVRCFITEYIDANKLVWSSFFSVWARCVIHQEKMNKGVQSFFILFFLTLLPAVVIAIFVTVKRHKIK